MKRRNLIKSLAVASASLAISKNLAAESFDEIELRRVLQSLVDGVLRADDIENAGAVSADTGKSYSGDLRLTI